MLIRVLGATEVRSSQQRSWTRPPPQQGAVLALLVAYLGRRCPTDRLVAAVWDEASPDNAERLLQGLVSRLRRTLEPRGGRGARLKSVTGGWKLELAADQVDVSFFEQLLRDAHGMAAKGRAEAASERLRRALGLWRGRPYADLRSDVLRGECSRLDEVYLDARELSLALRLDNGEHAAAAAEGQELVAAHPYREPLWALLIEAQWRAGRCVDALHSYERLRARLVSELGTEPSAQLRRLHHAVLRDDRPGLFADDDRGAPLRPSVQRRVRSWPCRRDLPLVGRGDELAGLRAHLDAITPCQRRLVLVSGEPGVGKTRLLADLADVAEGAGVDVLVGRCSHGAGMPYQAFVQALRADTEAIPDHALADRLGRDPCELARLVPELAPRTGLQPSTFAAMGWFNRQRLFDAVAGWLGAACGQRPLLLILDDVHEATPSTLLMLQHVVEVLTAKPLLLVAAYRDTSLERSTELVEALAAFAGLPGTHHVQLSGLPAPAVAELAALALGAGTDATTAATLHAATSGNPLFVQELLSSMSSSVDAGAQPSIGPGRLPWSLRRLVRARLQRLQPSTVRLLEYAAVVGQVFDFGLLADAASTPDEAALDGLDEAIAARLVIESGTGADQYVFSHEVMRWAVLEGLSSSRHRRLYAKITGALEQRHGDDLDADIVRHGRGRLAFHPSEGSPAGNRTRAISFSEAAGDAAMAQLAYHDAPQRSPSGDTGL